MENKEIWYPLKCNGIYSPFQYSSDDYLDKNKICNTQKECIELCRKLNRQQKQMFNNGEEIIDIDYFNQMIRDYVDKTLKIGNVMYYKNINTHEYMITLKNGKRYVCKLNFEEI